MSFWPIGMRQVYFRLHKAHHPSPVEEHEGFFDRITFGKLAAEADEDIKVDQEIGGYAFQVERGG